MSNIMIIRTKNWIGAANTWLSQKTMAHKARSLYLPAGGTPLGLYAQWRKHPHPALDKLALYQLDEIEGRFAAFFRQQLPDRKVHPPCAKTADMAILGLGMNGHVAFHEPDIPATFRFGKVPLHADTVRGLRLQPGTEALTVGIGILLETKAVLLIMLGSEKWKIFERARAGDTFLPVTALLKHPDLTVLSDQVK